MYFILLFLGIVFLLYFLCIAFFVGHGTSFYFIWLFLGAGAFALAFLIKKGIWAEHIPLLTRRIFVIAAALFAAVFMTVEGFVISGFSSKGPEGLDYLIVLGAQMKHNGPSRALQYRLDEAVRYLEVNPDTMVIVSGGQGRDEHISEAQGMYDYLVQQGIEPARILKEDASRNTFQNLTFSAEFLNKENASVGVVSNNFHIFRAVRIARKAGYGKVYGIASESEGFLQANNMMREFFGVMKDLLSGNM